MEVSFSLGKYQASILQKVDLAMTKKVMDTTEQKGNQMVEMLKASQPNLGNSIDIKG
ncbi:YjfB family protein [Aquibacillus kalidii]|uniref:YjfB family protein n=1 Tax=Aquibacillus kalidii TaxID=2762597 RepID=UPI001645E163|nr:YjfB family protein [Aquibacillus kalidii]